MLLACLADAPPCQLASFLAELSVEVGHAISHGFDNEQQLRRLDPGQKIKPEPRCFELCIGLLSKHGQSSVGECSLKFTSKELMVLARPNDAQRDLVRGKRTGYPGVG